MEFSDFFLDKLLNDAVSFYRNNKDIYVNPIPTKFKSIDESIEFFKNALVKEAHNSMKNEISIIESPILHAVNLDTETPGIVAGESKDKNNEKKFVVYKKDKPKKEKTPEQIQKDILRAQERELKKQEAAAIRNKEKEDIKTEKNEIKENNKQIKGLQKETNTAMKIAKEYKTRADEINKKFNNTSNPDKQLKEQHKIINDNSDKYTKLYEDALSTSLSLEEKTKKRENAIQKMSEEKQKIKDEKKVINQKKKEDLIKLQKERMDEKTEIICETNDENDMGAMDDLFDTLIEAGKDLENNTSNEKFVNLDNVKLYESPLPFQRHIEAIKTCEPNSLIIKTLLNGSNTVGDSYIKLIHGPPGTGKTYSLIKELKKMVADKHKHTQILICAPSNIATTNLYDRAISEGIDCSLIISSRSKLASKSKDETIKRVIFSTVSMSTSSKLKNVEFSSIMMDEASQCQEAWFWGLLKPTVKYIYMTGDPHQLPALVSKEGNKLNHERSFMDRMISIGYKNTLLDTQRRMHPDIVKFPNFKYYGNKLKTNYNSSDIIDNIKPSIEPFKICNTSSKEQRVGTSYQNVDEANKVISIYNDLKEKANSKDFTIIIISPYNSQCKLLKSLDSTMEIHSVDSFQGKEADAVILTTVRTENLGFWSDYRRLNVAMTRAKHIFRIVGNTESWNEGPLNDLREFYK
jgi:superfamily I DNA and/or RNA helicase